VIVADLLQFLFAGLMVGAIYALVAIGFNIIFNATGAVNFAQGEFVMLGGMLAASLLSATGLPLPS
jgi:branched-chain amino acid transport system permease protein